MIQIDEKKHTPKKLIILLVALVVLLTLVGLVKFFIDQKVTTVQQQEQMLIKESVLLSLQNGDYDSAITSAQDYVAKYPEKVDGYLALASAYLQVGSVEFEENANADEAIVLLGIVLTINPNNEEAYRLLGYAYEIKEDYKTALENYNRALSINPTYDEVYNSRGHAHELLGDYESAEADYIDALSYNSQNYLAQLNLASLYLVTGRGAEFDIEFMVDRVLKNSQDVRIIAEAFQLAGTLYAERGDYEEASLLFNDSLEYDDRLTASWMGRAFVDIQLLGSGYAENDEEEGLLMDDIFEALDVTLEINPYQTTAYMIHGILAGMGGESEIEKEFYQDALEISEVDITLGSAVKVEVQNILKKLIAEVDSDEYDVDAIQSAIKDILSNRDLQTLIDKAEADITEQ